MHNMVMAACELLGQLIVDRNVRPHQRIYAATVVEGATARLGPAS